MLKKYDAMLVFETCTVKRGGKDWSICINLMTINGALQTGEEICISEVRWEELQEDWLIAMAGME